MTKGMRVEPSEANNKTEQPPSVAKPEVDKAEPGKPNPAASRKPARSGGGGRGVSLLALLLAAAALGLSGWQWQQARQQQQAQLRGAASGRRRYSVLISALMACHRAATGRRHRG